MTTAPNKRNRLMLLLIAGIPVIVILTATWLWFFVARGDLDLVGALGTSNQGTLVQPPRPFAELTAHDAMQREFSYADVDSRWTMLIPNSGASCGRQCESRLYLTRQIHIAMGKDVGRIRRMYVAADVPPAATLLSVDNLSDDTPLPDSFEQFLDTQHRGLLPIQLGQGDFSAMFSEYPADPNVWYLADPAGWIMMSYNADVTYKDVIADLKFLLKNSSE
ncbi:MAG: hypothetical protein ACJAYC_001761 [Halieaceae bacterium]|jgi:hypothetical protein